MLILDTTATTIVDSFGLRPDTWVVRLPVAQAMTWRKWITLDIPRMAKERECLVTYSVA